MSSTRSKNEQFIYCFLLVQNVFYIRFLYTVSEAFVFLSNRCIQVFSFTFVYRFAWLVVWLVGRFIVTARAKASINDKQAKEIYYGLLYLCALMSYNDTQSDIYAD